MTTYYWGEDGMYQKSPSGFSFRVTCHGTKCITSVPKKGTLCNDCKGAIWRYRRVFKKKNTYWDGNTRYSQWDPKEGVSIQDELWARKEERKCFKIPDTGHDFVIEDMQRWYDILSVEERKTLNYWDLVFQG